MKPWCVFVLLIRFFLFVYTIIQVAAQVNFYSMGIESGRWDDFALPLSLEMINFLLLLETVGAFLTAAGLFARLGPFLLLAAYGFIAYHIKEITGIEFWLICALCLLLAIVGTGRLGLDRMIKG